MTSDWQRVRTIFEEAVDLPAPERPAFLDRACEGDAALRAEVEALLRVDERVAAEEKPFEASAELHARLAFIAGVPQLVGTRVGQFKIEGVIGSGGMSLVYEAVQERPQRKVALKMMRSGLHSAQARRRLEYESEILARLRHPGIAQVYAFGTFGFDGLELPYFAMERVEDARSLDNYVQQSGLDLGATIALFRCVCEAVHHGHQRGVIHRDLKPANILVDRDGNPKIIDYGIARVSDPQVTMQTMPGQLLGTLQYMSPEQLSADVDGVDARSDVYGLGVILFELLVGRPPHDLGDMHLTQALARLREAKITRPSTMTERNLPADLDWITLQAMAADPDRRYASAAALAEDLGRYLRCQPVAAGPPTAGYVIRKFVQRHRVAVIASSLALVALVALTVTALVNMVRAQRAVAESGQVNALMTDWLAYAHMSGSGEETRLIDLLEKADEDLSRADLSPRSQVMLHYAVGAAYLGMRRLEDAEPHLERAVQLGREALGSKDPATLTAINNYALLMRAKSEEPKAEALLREVLEGRLEVLGERHVLTAESMSNFGGMLASKGDFVKGCELLERALEIMKTFDSDAKTVTTATGLAANYVSQGRLDEAESLLRWVLDTYTTRLGPDHDRIAMTSLRMGVLFLRRRQLDEARRHYESAAAIWQKNLGPSHVFTLWAQRGLAEVLYFEERQSEAEAALQRLLEVAQPNANVPLLDKLEIRLTLCRCLWKQGKSEEALEQYETIVAGADAGLPEDHARRGYYHCAYGEALSEMRQFDEAERQLDESIRLLEACVTVDHAWTQRALRAAAEMYRHWNKPEKQKAIEARLSDG